MEIFRIPPSPLEKTEFLEGDLLFLAAGESGELPPFEHVAIVLRAHTAVTANKIADLEVFALPESIVDRLPWGTTARVAWMENRNDWVRMEIQEGRLGDPVSGWNVGSRLDLTPDQRRFLRTQGKMEIGVRNWEYEPCARIAEEPNGTVKTNCVGFVRWMFRYVARHKELVVGTFRNSDGEPLEYHVPFGMKEKRNYASPGHLARAADLTADELPYDPDDVRQAERDAVI